MYPLVKRMRPVHPGEILREDYLVSLDMSAHALAMALRVPATRIHAIVNERRSITANTAERLARYLGGDDTSWLNLQATDDLKTLPTRKEIMKASGAEGRVRPAASGFKPLRYGSIVTTLRAYLLTGSANMNQPSSKRHLISVKVQLDDTAVTARKRFSGHGLQRAVATSARGTRIFSSKRRLNRHAASAR